MKRGTLILGLLLAAAPVVGRADPVTVTDTYSTAATSAACAIWVAPSGAQYEWTVICGGQFDGDGDGDTDQRVGVIYKELCEGDDPSQDSVCSGGPTVRLVDLTASEFTMGAFLDGAGLHADMDGCRLDLDWTATGAPSTTVEDEIPPRVIPVLNPPAASVEIAARTYVVTLRDASMTGTVCPDADVTGAAKTIYLASASNVDRSKKITVDPTA